MPGLLTAAAINALQDLVIDLFADKRTAREWPFDPMMFSGNSAGNFWQDDTDSNRLYLEASGASCDAVIPMPSVAGDRVVSWEISLWQEGSTAFSARVYSIDSSGARTQRSILTTSGAGGEQKWHDLASGTVNYTIAADETIVVEIVSAQTGDKIGGGSIKADHP